MTAVQLTVASYVVYTAMILAIVFWYENQRDYWYGLILYSVVLPFFELLNPFFYFWYDESFVRIPGILIPLFSPAAYSWFYGVSLVVLLRYGSRIDRLPLGQQIAVIFVIHFCWDLILEYAFASMGLLHYAWPKELMIGKLPWFEVTVVASICTGRYFAHKLALVESERRGWIEGFVPFARNYLVVWSLCYGISILLLLMVGFKGLVPFDFVKMNLGQVALH